MRQTDIVMGGLYTARVSGQIVTVRVDAIRTLQAVHTGYSTIRRESTVYDVTNLATGRRTTFRSARKFRGRAQPKESQS